MSLRADKSTASRARHWDKSLMAVTTTTGKYDFVETKHMRGPPTV
jgi:hypothetical protein